jgi:DNA-binding helix-turn-helix protein
MSEKELTELIEKIKLRRLELGLSYQELSDLTGINKSTLQRYETGFIKKVPINQVQIIAKALNVTPGYLMGWENNKENQTYYLNPEAAKMAQEIYDNPQYKVLFDATKKLKPESIKEVMKFIDYQKAKEEGE